MSGPIVLILRILLAILLYFFLGWTLYTLFLELKLHSTILETRKVIPITLTVQFRNQAPQLFHFQQANVIIGRNPACECRLNEESISSRHSKLSFHHGHWWLEDLGSTNGTYLNNEALLLPTVVVSGDSFRCGETSLTITLLDSQGVTRVKEIPDNE